MAYQTFACDREDNMFRVDVNFGRTLQNWDGFGVTYVEAAQTHDPAANPQDYGGLSMMSEEDQRFVLNAVFGDEGLHPSLAKIFITPFGQQNPPETLPDSKTPLDSTAYDFGAQSAGMSRAIAFQQEGLRLTRARGDDLVMLATLYGPPAWMTVQKAFRGRDLAPDCRDALANYLVAAARFCREQGLPIQYLSLHNEGESWRRWNAAGYTDNWNHDYNYLVTPELAADLLARVAQTISRAHIERLGVAPGEASNWTVFSQWGYPSAIENNPAALEALELITSHGFYGTDRYWPGDWRSAGIDRLRERKPGLKAWVTSASWGKMDVFFLWEIFHSIYSAKINGYIPWACIQNHSQWSGGDPNPGTAILVDDNGQPSLTKGYYFYKQATWAGPSGASVVDTWTNDSVVCLIGFGPGKGRDCENMVLLNIANEETAVTIRVHNARSRSFAMYRTSDTEQFAPLGACPAENGAMSLTVPPRSATTLIGNLR